MIIQNINGMENGHSFVDLGLPSGLLWATCNVGAESPEQAGLYFAWGETAGYTATQVKEGKRRFDFKSYILLHEPSILHFDYLTPEYDAAHINMGGKWRMPTKAELQELYDLTTSTFKKEYKKDHLEVCSILTSKINGNTLVLPVAGYVLGQDIFRNNEYCHYWYSDLDYYNVKYEEFIEGYTVRGVCER